MLEKRAETVEMLVEGAQNIALLVDKNAGQIAGGLKTAAQTLGIVKKDTESVREQLAIADKEHLARLKEINQEDDQIYKKHNIKTSEEFEQLLQKMSRGVDVHYVGGGEGGGMI